MTVPELVEIQNFKINKSESQTEIRRRGPGRAGPSPGPPAGGDLDRDSESELYSRSPGLPGPRTGRRDIHIATQ